MQNIDTSALAAAKAKLDAAEAQREEVLLRHIANGVDIRSRNVEIGSEVVIAPGAVILAGTILRGKTVIGAGCVIGPNTLIVKLGKFQGICIKNNRQIRDFAWWKGMDFLV